VLRRIVRRTVVTGVSAGEDIKVDEYLGAVGFLLPGNDIAIGRHAGEHGMAEREALCLCTDGRVEKPLAGWHDLAGQVQVTSPAMALQYARLFTSPATAYMLPGPRYEVVSLRVIKRDKAFLFGRPDVPQRPKVEDLRRAYESLEDAPLDLFGPVRSAELEPRCEEGKVRWYGILRNEEWREFGLRLPEVKEAEGEFAVKRMLFVPDESGRSQAALWTEEVIAADGRMQARELEGIPLEGGIVLAVPVYG
jgi:hypothetical protein